MIEWDEIRKDMIIDRANLDQACIDQADLYLKYAELLADAIEQRDIAKRALEETISDTDQRIRRNPENFGIMKITENAVSSAIVLDKAVQSIQAKLLELDGAVRRLEEVKRALEHRKKSLEILSQLFIASYFSIPNTSAPTVGSVSRVSVQEKRISQSARTALMRKKLEEK